MTIGYPDYQRLALEGGVQLYGTNGIPPQNAVLFEGYVGNWPYTSVFTLMGAGSDSFQFHMGYFTDSTFSTIVAEHVFARVSGSFAASQYGNLSDWLKFYYLSNSGLAASASNISVFGVSGWQSNYQMASNDVPLFLFNGSVAANTVSNQSVQHICPSNATFFWHTTLATWTINIQVWDYGSNSFKIFAVVDSTVFKGEGSISVPMIDAPYQIQLDNQTAAAGNFICSLMQQP